MKFTIHGSWLLSLPSGIAKTSIDEHPGAQGRLFVPLEDRIDVNVKRVNREAE